LRGFIVLRNSRSRRSWRGFCLLNRSRCRCRNRRHFLLRLRCGLFLVGRG